MEKGAAIQKNKFPHIMHAPQGLSMTVDLEVPTWKCYIVFIHEALTKS